MAPVYIIDHAAYKPPERLKVVSQTISNSFDNGEYHDWQAISSEAGPFLMKIFEKSGLSTCGTYLPECIHPQLTVLPHNDLNVAREEAHMVMVGAVQDLLDKTGIQVSDIGILVTCCSIYCPTPSSASMLVNHFKMSETIQSYHLGGMGCGTGVVAVRLIQDMLQAHPNSYALFVPSETTSYCYYPGRDKHRMVSNAIFRMGGAAVLFSNRRKDAKTAKYELLHSMRVHTGASDAAYGCMAWSPDSDGVNGVYLAKTVVEQAGIALRQCLQRITPRIMTWRQLAEAAVVEGPARLRGLVDYWIFGASTASSGGAAKAALQYVPDFTECVDHFAIHAGGYAVLKGVQQGMKLPNVTMLPSFASLRDYGNTSCSTTWYVMGYLESCVGVKRGQRIMQIGMGGGMKVGINIWRAMRDIHDDRHPAWTHLHGQPLTEDDLPRNIEAVVVEGAKPLVTAVTAVAYGTGHVDGAAHADGAGAVQTGDDGVVVADGAVAAPVKHADMQEEEELEFQAL